jgi:hypothetical protein
MFNRGSRLRVLDLSRLAFASFVVFPALIGCTRLGQPLQHVALPPGAPEASAILAGLAANDAAIRNFKAKGSMSLASPDFEGVKTCDDGLVAFRRPADLCVIGKKLVVGVTVFRLTCVGNEFLIEFPATPEEEPYYRVEGEHFASVPFSVSPSDIVREMFLPEEWRDVKQKDFRLVSYEQTRQQAEIEIGPKREPRRRILVTGPPWRVVRSERLDKDGTVVAVTLKENYREIDGVQFPTKIDASFPGEQTRMTIDMRKVWTNTDLDKSLFDVKARARVAGIDLSRGAQAGGEGVS